MEVPTISPPEPFRISFSDEAIARLHRRLADTRVPSRLLPDDPKHLPGSRDRTLHPDPEWLSEKLKEWSEFDIGAMESKLNRYRF
jgi:hypothetical protein